VGRRRVKEGKMAHVTMEEFRGLASGAEDRFELINGTVYDMSPSPKLEHQMALGYIGRVFGEYFRDKRCDYIPGPLDVFIEDNSVIPDAIVLCDESKIKEDRKYHGAPDLVIEVLSESTAMRDKTVKAAVYASSGVKEYWIVNPLRKNKIIVEVYYFLDSDHGYYYYSGEEIAESRLFTGLGIDVKELNKYTFRYQKE
jgi:Uma2 family endonuclease